MYLEFISDIANVGDLIKITTGKQVIEGEIIKISSSLIAVKNNNGSVVLCKDEDILDLQVNQENKNTPPKNISEAVEEQIELSSDDGKIIEKKSIEEPEENETNLETDEVTIGKYESSWDQLKQNSLLAIVEEIRSSLTVNEKNTIIASNANVREVLRRSFRVSTESQPKLSVNTYTVIETSLKQDLSHFSIGDSLPVVVYYHQVPYIEVKGVYLTLSPNTIGG